MSIKHGLAHNGYSLVPISKEEYHLLLRNMPKGYSIVSIPDEWRTQEPVPNPDIKPHGKDFYFKELIDFEWAAFSTAAQECIQEGRSNAHKRPKMTTLLEEFSEAVLACRGKHDDPLELELKQIAGVCINMLWQIAMGEDVNNIVTVKDE